MKRPFMFDTSAFNNLIEVDHDINSICEKGMIFITHVQRDEINSNKWVAKSEVEQLNKERILHLFNTLPDESIATESFILGVSRLGEARISNGETYKKIKVALDAIKMKPNNLQDALIGEAALRNSFILVTNDRSLFSVMKNFDCEVLSLDEFLALKN